MTRKIIDIETNDLLTTSLDYTALPYCLKDSFRLWMIVLRDIDTSEVQRLVLGDCTRENLKALLEDCTELAGHNIVNFDLPVLMLMGLLDYRIGYPGEPCTIFGKPCEITDTLIWSKLLSPDRLGGHSLESWGDRLGCFKLPYTDFSKYTPEMLTYCEQDTLTNLKAYNWLMTDKVKGNFEPAYSMERKLVDVTLRQSVFGFAFNKEKAEAAVVELDNLMQTLQARVDPYLPPRKPTQGEKDFYTGPAKPFKKDGSLSANAEKFATKINGKLLANPDGSWSIETADGVYPFPRQEPYLPKFVSSINDVDVVKGHLLGMGWDPSEWKERDLSRDQKKNKKTCEQTKEAIDRYIKQTFSGWYAQHRCDFIGVPCDPERMRLHLYKLAERDKPCKVITGPKLAVGLEKTICPNLEVLGERAAFVGDVVKYFTYKHRRNSILGGGMPLDYEWDEGEEPETGYLSTYRQEDGRIPTPADTLGANTGRYKHKIVCNIPRVTSLYGNVMRSLFGAGKGFWQLGFDFASLEARTQGHYCIPFTNGEELAKSLLAEKPNDIHCFSDKTEVLTSKGWINFSELTYHDLVGQYCPETKTVQFVKPEEIISDSFEGEMLRDPATNLLMTKEHRVFTKSYSEGLHEFYLSLAGDFRSSSDKRFVAGAEKTFEKTDDPYITVLCAVQADGSFSKDCSAITFSFVKDRKIKALENALSSLRVDYAKNTYTRRGREETAIRLNAGAFCEKIRADLPGKSFCFEILHNWPFSKLLQLLQEQGRWDGTVRSNGDIVIDSTDFTSMECLSAVAFLCGRKAKMKKYLKVTSYGQCQISRLYLSSVSKPYIGTKKFSTESYSGQVYCCSVPSGMVVVRHGTTKVAVVSGNSVNAKKLGISRPDAKNFTYATLYGAQARKIAKMLKISVQEAEDLLNAYWEANPAIRELKEKLEEYWESKDQKYILGLDRRLLSTRSRHSLLNVLLQGAGAIAVKWAIIRICQIMEAKGILGDPFVHTKTDPKVWQMIVMHDECQYAVHPSLMRVSIYETEEAAKADRKETDSAVGHGAKGYYLGHQTLPVQCIREGIEQATAELKMRVPLGIEWATGANWEQCH